TMALGNPAEVKTVTVRAWVCETWRRDSSITMAPSRASATERPARMDSGLPSKFRFNFMKTYRVLIVDDEALTRRAIRRLLAAESDMEVAGECEDGEQI